jgi:hypothetical protein
MEQIPEVRENDLGISITRRYAGGFEVSISYAGTYIRRYPLVQVTDIFLTCLTRNIPFIGWWIFRGKRKREEVVMAAYARAIDDFIKVIKLDVADSIFGAKDSE